MGLQFTSTSHVPFPLSQGLTWARRFSSSLLSCSCSACSLALANNTLRSAGDNTHVMYWMLWLCNCGTSTMSCTNISKINSTSLPWFLSCFTSSLASSLALWSKSPKSAILCVTVAVPAVAASSGFCFSFLSLTLASLASRMAFRFSCIFSRFSRWVSV